MTDESEKEFAQLCELVGYVVIHWGIIEAQVDAWVKLAYHLPGGKAIAGSFGIPRSLKRKLHFLRECFSSLPSLALFSERGSHIVNMLSLVSKVRHELVHGAMAIGEKNQSIRYIRMKYEKDDISSQELLLSTKDYPQIKNEFSDLLSEMRSLSVALLNAFSAC